MDKLLALVREPENKKNWVDLLQWPTAFSPLFNWEIVDRIMTLLWCRADVLSYQMWGC